jgi:3-methyladenine DNA glycosylase AlkC
MAPQLKHFFDAGRARRLADELHAAWPDFPRARFVAEASAGLDELELMDRAGHFARAMRATLPAEFEAAVDVLLGAVGPALGHVDGAGMEPFHYLPHLRFVADHGLDHFEASMRAQHTLTQRMSAEFSIRAFLERHPERTLARLSEWASDPNHHVRRLVSEGTRPRLPWASRLKRFQQDPTPTLALLERLKDDPELYVRRSVANHLNDIGKDHPALLLQVAERWMVDATPERAWIVTHALRSAVKKGDPRALAIRGFAGGDAVSVRSSVSPSKIRLGETFQVQVALTNDGDAPLRAVVDLIVHFVKANGAAKPKVFKGRDLELEPGERTTVTKSVSTADLSTRTHYPGEHAVDVQINGRATRVGSVWVEPR